MTLDASGFGPNVANSPTQHTPKPANARPRDSSAAIANGGTNDKPIAVKLSFKGAMKAANDATAAHNAAVIGNGRTHAMASTRAITRHAKTATTAGTRSGSDRISVNNPAHNAAPAITVHGCATSLRALRSAGRDATRSPRSGNAEVADANETTACRVLASKSRAASSSPEIIACRSGSAVSIRPARFSIPAMSVA